MKTRLVFFLIKMFIVGILLVGIILLLVSLQSFETLASLLNQLASDGELESFTLSLYQTLRLPFALVGSILIFLTGFPLWRWKKTVTWLHGFLMQARRFLSLLRDDTLLFMKDTRTAITGQGRLTNLVLLGSMFAATVARLVILKIPLGHDEPYMYNAFASRSFWHIMTNYHLPNNHVLLSLIMKVVTSVLGNHVWTLRLPTIIVGVLMVPVVYFFAKRFYSKETAIVSAILVAVFPILVQYSVMARGYIIIGLIALLIFTLGDYVRIRKNRFVWGLIAVLSALGFYTIPIMFFPFGALYIWLFVSWILDDTHSYKSKSDFLKYWLGSGLGAALMTIILYAPIMVYSFDRFFGNGFIAPVTWDLFPVTIWTRLRNTWTDWTLSIPTPVVILAVLGFLISLIFHRRFSRQKFAPQLAFLLWIVTLLVVRRPDMLPRFWLFLAAPLLTWCVAGVVESLRKIPFTIGKGWNPVQVSIVSLFVVVLIQSVISLPSVPAQVAKKDEMEQASIYLKDQIGKNDLVTASTAHLPALRYYFNYYDVPSGYIRQSGKFRRAFIIVDSDRNETLRSVAPKLGFDIPAIDMDTAKVLTQFDYLTVYECYPTQ